MALAQPSGFVGCIGPRGGRIDVAGALAVLPRKELDLILCRAAVAAGARMFAPLRFVAPLEANDGSGETRVVGATLRHGDTTRELRARWVVLASGAVPQALMAAGMSAHLHAQRRGAARLREERRDGRPHRQARGRLAPRAHARLRLDLPVRGRRLQHRRRHRPQPARRQVGQARAEPAPGDGRLRQRLRPRARADGNRHAARPDEGRAAALHARRRALRRARPARHRRGRGQHLRVHRRGHRQGDGDRHPRRRGGADRRGRCRGARRLRGASCARSSRASTCTSAPTA